ncbi:hypothetical protein EV361DRAFT_759395, partial [Lentinula raphanica]
ISPSITYMLRCNTDVTSLLSGTAIKAAVSYVTDYITKTGLKTHVIFDSIRVIFEKNTDIVHGSHSDKDKSRLLMTKMVNLLATKLELGSPMICMYLLQNPDHYTSHYFIPFYWNTFVAEARKYWYPNDISEDNRVLLVKRKNTYIGLSSTYDYTHRPLEHQQYNLYDWISRYTRVKRYTRSKKKDTDVQNEDFDLDEQVCVSSDQFSFIEGHPLGKTHRVQKFRSFAYNIPNFLGPPLPRPDKDDREYYCCTMLVLYKPWRSGADLKQTNESWHEAFSSYDFSESAKMYIKNMNLRYECLDSRDDFRSQLKAGKISLLPNSIPFDLDLIKDQLQSSLYTQSLNSEHEIIDDENNETIVLYDPDTGMQKGKTCISRERAMKAMRDILFSSGWTNSICSQLDNLYSNTSFNSYASFDIPVRSPDDWLNVIKLMRQELLLERKYQGKVSSAQSTLNSNTSVEKTINRTWRPNIVEICDKSYFDKLGIDYGSIKEGTENIIKQFNLNSEQERAFRIIAHHS